MLRAIPVLLAVATITLMGGFGKAQGQSAIIYIPLVEKALVLTFGPGQKIVGTDVLPGTYRTRLAK